MERLARPQPTRDEEMKDEALVLACAFPVLSTAGVVYEGIGHLLLRAEGGDGTSYWSSATVVCQNLSSYTPGDIVPHSTARRCFVVHKTPCQMAL